jgi:hypothetical protein
MRTPLPFISLASLAVCCLTSAVAAQSPPRAQRGAPASPVADALRSHVQRAGRNLLAAAEEMPAGKYGFKPTPAQMSFGEVIAHVAAGSDALCSSIGGLAPPKRAELGAGAPKEKLVDRLRDTFRFCESALAKLDDSKLSGKVPYFGADEVPRADVMFAAAEEWAGHYSQLAVYLRLNGLVPPTAR